MTAARGVERTAQRASVGAVRGGATAEEVAAVLAVLQSAGQSPGGHSAGPAATSPYGAWRAGRHAALRRSTTAAAVPTARTAQPAG